jgi:hypothetical protein
MSWVGRLRRWAPVSAISVERVRFDTQALENPEILSVEYHLPLAGALALGSNLIGSAADPRGSTLEVMQLDTALCQPFLSSRSRAAFEPGPWPMVYKTN